MALRQVRIDGDPILRKESKPVRKITDRIEILLEDMVETMEVEEGVGLAAPQVGVLRRIIVIDIGEGPIKMINPEIYSESGEEVGPEGCLSVPGKAGTVERPKELKVKYMDENGEKQDLEAEGFLARVICHEIDHLNGILYTDKVIDYIDLEADDEEDDQYKVKDKNEKE